MKTRFSDLPLQWKITFIYVLSSFMILAVNLSILIGINTMSSRLESTYETNLYLNDMGASLSDVQEALTEFLSVKSSDTLEDYYRTEQDFRWYIDQLSDEHTTAAYDVMQRNIRNMSEEYLETATQTIDAKRSRNVEKYRVRYENATELYNYLESYINSLNTRQFEENSKTYGMLSKSLSTMENFSILIMIVFIVVNSVMIINYTGRLTKPLKNLAKSADAIAKGDFDTSLPEAPGKDEIGVVTTAFNKMVISIRDYIAQIRENMELERKHKEKELLMETHLKDAQLKYLQAQINPHFLFNTLNAGAQLAMLEGADRTYEFVQNMSEFFRYNVKQSDKVITLKDEITLVDHYIYIINVRFSGDIAYEKNVDESLLNVKIPSMILQPIVENAVNHGIRNMEGKGRITLSVKRIEDTVLVSIKDNGVGMTPERIRQVLEGDIDPEQSSSMDSNGVGLDNVINRLKMFLDTDDVLSIVSEGEGTGTEFIIYLPFEESSDV